MTPYGTEIVEAPDLQKVFIFDIGGPHTFREILRSRKPHPKNLVPSYYGDSRGHWEGDTLIVETTDSTKAFGWTERVRRTPRS